MKLVHFSALPGLKISLVLSLLGTMTVLSACGKQKAASPSPSSISASRVDSEGLPVVETAETIGPDADNVAMGAPSALEEAEEKVSPASTFVTVGAKAGYSLPNFDPSWGLSRAVYDKAVTYMDLHERDFANQRYAVVIDMSKHASKQRFFLFDLEAGRLEKHNVAHGVGSDPEPTGYARYFSNKNDSRKTSLGAYRTAGTYQGKHGLHMRLAGLEPSNSMALQRGIVVHAANYVSDGGHAGRSWGCPAVDPRIVKSVINRVKGGAFFLIWK